MEEHSYMQWRDCHIRGDPQGEIVLGPEKFFVRRFRFGSDDEETQRLGYELIEFLEEMGYGTRGHEMFMAVNETAINIAEHANHKNPGVPVYISHWRAGNRVYMPVGGNPSKYDIGIWHRDDTRAIQKRGWGTKLTQTFADLIVLDQDLSGVLLGFDLERRIS